MRFDVSYCTVFTYEEPASESQNELRAAPVTNEHQRLIDYRVTVDPPARVLSYHDAWGTRVDAFGVRKPHTSMEVLAEASVETSPQPLTAVAPRMESLVDAEFAEDHVAYLFSDEHTDAGPAVRDAAKLQSDLAGDDVVSTVLAVHRFVGRNLTYTPGSTDIGIAVDDVLTSGMGVCQDYSHLAVAMCRSLGIPARYVSGYLFTEDDSAGADTSSDTVVVQTHAWFEAAIPGGGWLALDPTNGQNVGERHVKIGHGRSYDDVQPLRGAFLGPSASAVRASVEIRRTHSHVPARQTVGAFGPTELPSDEQLIRAQLQQQTLMQQQQQQQQQ